MTLFLNSYFSKIVEINKSLPENFKPKLLKCSFLNGKFSVTHQKIIQRNLNHNHCYVLDVHWAIFFWVGLVANLNEKISKPSKDFVLKYFEKNTEKDEKTIIYKVDGGYEPTEFISYFPYWSNKIICKNPRIKLKIRVPKSLKDLVIIENPKSSNTFYPYGELSKTIKPIGLDRGNLEKYLADKEFQSIFKMDKEKFNKLAKWKKVQLKKNSNYFKICY